MSANGNGVPPGTGGGIFGANFYAPSLGDVAPAGAEGEAQAPQGYAQPQGPVWGQMPVQAGDGGYTAQGYAAQAQANGGASAPAPATQFEVDYRIQPRYDGVSREDPRVMPQYAPQPVPVAPQANQLPLGAMGGAGRGYAGWGQVPAYAGLGQGPGGGAGAGAGGGGGPDGGNGNGGGMAAGLKWLLGLGAAAGVVYGGYRLWQWAGKKKGAGSGSGAEDEGLEEWADPPESDDDDGEDDGSED